MLPKKSEKIVAPDSPVSAGSTIRRQQLLLDPIDNRTGVYLQKPADVVRGIDSFRFRLCHVIVI